MTRADLANRIQASTDFNRKDSADILQSVLNIVTSTLEAGETVKISGFGNFEVRAKIVRNGRNPQTGEPIKIDARRVLTFKPSAVLKKTINQAE